jgi:probable HAF family extracellular repeat protein
VNHGTVSQYWKVERCPGSAETVADGINAKGQIIGYYWPSYSPSGTHQQGFLDSGGTYTIINPPGSTYTDPESINVKGQIVGVYQDANHNDHGFLYSNGTYTTIDFPGANYITWALVSINNTGQIAGDYEDSRNSQLHGFIYSYGTYTTIDVPAPLLRASTKRDKSSGSTNRVMAATSKASSTAMASTRFYIFPAPIPQRLLALTTLEISPGITKRTPRNIASSTAAVFTRQSAP